MARPTIFTKQVLQKLEEAFAWGCTDEEACLNADISPSSLYNYQNQNSEFLERKEQLKNRPVLKARQVVFQAMEKNPMLAFKFLERKRPDEFGEPAISNISGRADEATQWEEMREDYRKLIEDIKSAKNN